MNQTAAATKAPLDRLPDGLVSLGDHEAHAREVVSPGTWAYIHGGAADELTLAANQQAWRQIPLRPRVLRRLDGLDTRVTLLGKALAHPLIVAPMAHQKLVHPHGELATALASSVLSAGMTLSLQSSTRLEEVAALFRSEPARSPLWFQLYWLGDRSIMAALLQRAADAGCEGIVLTVDAPVQGVRDRERRAGFQLPPHVSSVILNECLEGRARARSLDQLLAQSASWEDLDWLRSRTGLPIVLKGITHPDDLREAINRGADAVVVSNHGGRILDTMPSTASLLTELASVANGDIPILVDGGIRRGTDVFKAIALGATGVMVGRPVLHGLANGGAAGVAHVLRLLLDELQATMALCGCNRLSDAKKHLGKNVLTANASNSHL